MSGDRSVRPGPIRGSMYGLHVVADALGDLAFPATKDHVLAILDEQRVEYGDGQQIPLRELIAESDQDSFESLAGVVSAVSQGLERRGATGRDGQQGTVHN